MHRWISSDWGVDFSWADSSVVRAQVIVQAPGSSDWRPVTPWLETAMECGTGINTLNRAAEVLVAEAKQQVDRTNMKPDLTSLARTLRGTDVRV